MNIETILVDRAIEITKRIDELMRVQNLCDYRELHSLKSLILQERTREDTKLRTLDEEIKKLSPIIYRNEN